MSGTTTYTYMAYSEFMWAQYLLYSSQAHVALSVRIKSTEVDEFGMNGL